MTKQDKPASEMPLAGGDYVDKGQGLKQVGTSTEPPVNKSVIADATSPRRATTSEPAATSTTPARTTTSKTP